MSEPKNGVFMSEETNYRIEIIANQSVQEDITELLEQEIPEIQYTVIPTVQGRGAHSKKLGSTTWPEQNFVLFAYLSKNDAKKAQAVISAVKQKFASEGITFFCVQEANL